jgi:hypothetical protein
MNDPISLLNILVPLITSMLGVLLGIASAFLAYRQKNKELEQQFSAQKEQLRLLGEQVQHEHLKMESEFEQIRKANLSPEEQAALTVSLLPTPTVHKKLEYWPHRSPYIVGLPISDPSHYFRNKNQVKDFYGRVLGPQLNCLSILGARRSGKTSFINLLCHPLVHEQYLTPVEIQRLVMVNLNLQSGITSPGLFFRYLVLKTFEAVQKHGDPNEIRANLPTTINEHYVTSFFKGLRENGWRIILILDELEKLGEIDLFDIAFFDFLRSLSNDSDGKIAWVTTSYREVDKVQCNKGKQDTSAFFNLYNQKIFLGGLSTEEARKLICLPAEVEKKIIYQEEDIDFLICLAGLMPFPLQASASLLYHNYIQNSRGMETHQQLGRLFAENMEKFYDHYWQHFELSEQKVLKKLAHERQIETSENQFVRDLINYGFLIDQQTISSETFRDWIRSQ